MDLARGLELAPLWLRLGWDQTRSRFQRTVLGPFWLAGTLLATALALWFVFGRLFGMNYDQAFPYIIVGILGWNLIGAGLGEATGVFSAGAGLMQVLKLPLSFHAFIQLHRLLINFGAQLITTWVVLFLLQKAVVPHWTLLPGLLLVLGNVFFATLVIGFPSTRFRDVNYLVGFVVQILFFVTPVFWHPSQAGGQRSAIIAYNPLAHWLSLIREPMLGRPPLAADWQWGLATLIGLALATICLLIAFRKRVVFWL